jgi:hypothetical protein
VRCVEERSQPSFELTVIGERRPRGDQARDRAARFSGQLCLDLPIGQRNGAHQTDLHRAERGRALAALDDLEEKWGSENRAMIRLWRNA